LSLLVLLKKKALRRPEGLISLNRQQPALRPADFIDPAGRPDYPASLVLAVNLVDAGHFQSVQLGEPKIPPLSVPKVTVKNDEAKEQILAVKLDGIPVAAAKEEVKMDKLLPWL
jgi:hypothetical protein